jgi:Mg/Co/Ni transporter MgtE
MTPPLANSATGHRAAPAVSSAFAAPMSALASMVLFVPLIIGMGQSFGTQLPATAGAIATSVVAVDQARPA